MAGHFVGVNNWVIRYNNEKNTETKNPDTIKYIYELVFFSYHNWPTDNAPLCSLYLYANYSIKSLSNTELVFNQCGAAVLTVLYTYCSMINVYSKFQADKN